jgi:hypothetical protein
MDPTMDIMLAIAYGLVPLAIPIQLPASMQDPRACAALVHAIDGPTVLDFASPIALGQTLAARLGEISSGSAALMPDVADDMLRLVIGLRVWTGCMDAAKLLRDVAAGDLEYTPQMRMEGFTARVDPIAAQDAIYRAGVEAAPTFRRNRGQPLFDDGVPAESTVRRHWAV